MFPTTEPVAGFIATTAKVCLVAIEMAFQAAALILFCGTLIGLAALFAGVA